MLSTWCDVHVTPPSERSQTPLWRRRTGTPLWGNWDTHIPREGTAQLKITAPPCSASLGERKHYSVVISTSFQIPVWKPAPERWLKWISLLIWLLFPAEKPLLLPPLSWYPLQCQKKWSEILKWFKEDFVCSEIISGPAWKQPKLKILALNLSGCGLDRKKSRVSCQTVKQLPAWRCRERALCFWNQLKDFFPPQIIKGSTGGIKTANGFIFESEGQCEVEQTPASNFKEDRTKYDNASLFFLLADSKRSIKWDILKTPNRRKRERYVNPLKQSSHN